MRHCPLVLVLALLAPTLVLAQARTPNLNLRYTGDQKLNDNFVRIDEALGSLLPSPWTSPLGGRVDAGNCRNAGITVTGAEMRVCSNDTSLHSFSVWNDSGGGMKQVFIIENNGDGGLNGTQTDVNLRNAVLNMGDIVAASSGAVPIIFQSPTGTSTLNLISIMKVGDGPTGLPVFTVNSLGVLSLRNRGIASTVMNVCANSDTSCSTPVWRMSEDATMSWGSGSGSPDTQLLRSAASTLRTAAGDAIGTAPTDTPPTCAAAVEGTMYYDDSMNEPCYCNGSNWVTFDGSGGTPSSTSCG